MRNFVLFGLAAALALGVTASAGAVTTVIDINSGSCDDGTCSDYEALSQSLGDSAIVDVSHRSLTLGGAVYEQSLKYWNVGYGDLTGIAWGGADQANYRGQWTFTPIAGYEISLISFEAGCYQNRASCQTVSYSVTDGAGAAVTNGTQSTAYPGHATVALDTLYSSNGLVLTWGPDSYDVGLDKLTFDVRAIDAPAVPEPASWAMLIAGFGLIGGRLRLRTGTIRTA
ncbi:PEPxxWA-CTERM sorting domain-containing protein [Sphingomonas sp. ID0503]|uniref:PEPxxWA-CTERM sorting domain-containing protein n=1 Tax=Sphingomonas sp. ID0503 TaxID=3399691 RepID=UPI003AFA2DF6